MWKWGQLALVAILLAVGQAWAGNDEKQLPDATLSAEIPSGILDILVDIQDLRLKKNALLLEFELKGRESSRRKIEKIEAEQAEKVKAMDEELLQTLKSYRRDIERTIKKMNRLEDQLAKIKDNPKQEEELDAQIAELKLEVERPQQILDAFESILPDLKEMVKGAGSRIPAIMANTGGKFPNVELETLDGKAWDKKDAIAASNVVFVFWAGVNPTSIKALEQVAKLHGDLAEAKTKIVAVAVDTEPDTVTKVAKDIGGDLTFLTISRSEAAEKHVNLVPLIVFVEKGGIIHSSLLGYTSKLRGMIGEILNDQAEHAKGGR